MFRISFVRLESENDVSCAEIYVPMVEGGCISLVAVEMTLAVIQH
jgi:hypothetical protein